MAVRKDKVRLSREQEFVQRQLGELERLERPYERALGKLAMQFSVLHFKLEYLSWKAWNLNTSVGAIVTKDLRITHLAEKLEATAKHVIPKLDDRKEFLSLLKEVKQVAKKRNELLHSSWVFSVREPIKFMSRTRGCLIGAEVPSAKQVNQLSFEVVRTLAGILLFEFKNPFRANGLWGSNVESDKDTDK